MGQKLSRGILSVLIANIINLSFNLVSNFLLPKYLSVDTYAHIKTFTLLLSYAGFLHLGYADGMYLKYGGKDRRELEIIDLEMNLSIMRIFQVAISIGVIIVGLTIKDYGVVIFGCTLMPYNMSWYFRNLYQAIGEFITYGRVLNVISITLFVLNMGLLFLIRTDVYIHYLFVYFTVYFSTWIFIEYRVRNVLQAKLRWVLFSTREFKENIQSGFLLMLGTFSSNLLTSMDRWFVKGLFDNVAFAQYSFAVSMESFLNVAITPITVTLYNFFCKTNNVSQIQRIKRYVMIFSSFLISSAFWGDWILRIWLPNYLGSTTVMYCLFCSQFFYIIIRSIYVNLYNAQKRQKTYFINITIVIFSGFISNGIIYVIFHNKESFAIATLLSAILWFFLCIKDFSGIKLTMKDLAYIIICPMAFLLCSIFIGSLFGFIIYIVILVIVCFVLMKRESVELIGYVAHIMDEKLNRMKSNAPI